MAPITKMFSEKDYDADDHRKIEELQHHWGGPYVKDAVYAANDGLVTTFAVMAGVVGAALSPAAAVIIGLASLFADGFSMAIGNYLGSKSEQQWHDQLEAIEEWEVEHIPDVEKKEIRRIYAAKGFTGETLDRIVAAVANDKELWVREMMAADYGVLENTQEASPLQHGVATFIAFVVAGFLPIIPFLVFTTELFQWAAIFTAIGLFVVGALRTLVTYRRWWLAGLEMLLLGSFAAAIAYFVGSIAAGWF